MKKIFVFLALFSCHFFSLAAVARDLVFLELPHPSPRKILRYRLSFDEEDCRVQEKEFINLTLYDRELDREQIPNVLESFYYKLELQKVNEQQAVLGFSSMKNMRLLVISKKVESKCQFENLVDYGGEVYHLLSFNLEYGRGIGVPQLKRILLRVRTAEGVEKVITLGAYDLEGYLPFYEASVGMGINVHTNIRPHNKMTFHRGNPIIEPIPIFLIRYGPFFLNKDGAGLLLLPMKNFLVLGTFLFDGEPYRADGIKERKKTIFFGPLVRSGNFQILYMKDVQNTFSGVNLKVSFAPEFYLPHRWVFSPIVFYQYWDHRYVNYYYGVDAQEAQQVGRTYRADSTSNYGLTLRNLFSEDRWTYLLNIDWKFYGAEVYRSPIVNRRQELRFISGIVYKLL